MDIAISKNSIPIRLTAERWEQIVSNKDYMESRYEDVLRAIENPSAILRGYKGSLVAVLNLSRHSFFACGLSRSERELWICNHCVHRA